MILENYKKFIIVKKQSLIGTYLKKLLAWGSMNPNKGASRNHVAS